MGPRLEIKVGQKCEALLNENEGCVRCALATGEWAGGPSRSGVMLSDQPTSLSIRSVQFLGVVCRSNENVYSVLYQVIERESERVAAQRYGNLPFSS